MCAKDSVFAECAATCFHSGQGSVQDTPCLAVQSLCVLLTTAKLLGSWQLMFDRSHRSDGHMRVQLLMHICIVYNGVSSPVDTLVSLMPSLCAEPCKQSSCNQTADGECPVRFTPHAASAKHCVSPLAATTSCLLLLLHAAALAGILPPPRRCCCFLPLVSILRFLPLLPNLQSRSIPGLVPSWIYVVIISSARLHAKRCQRELDAACSSTDDNLAWYLLSQLAGLSGPANIRQEL